MLNVAYANMQETVGEGLVDAFTILSGDQGIGAGIIAMDKFGDSIADVTRGVATLITGFKDIGTYGRTVLDIFKNLDPFAPLTAIGQLGKPKPAPFRTPMTISGSTDSQVKIDKARAKAEADAAKRAKELLALTKKQVKAQEAQQALDYCRGCNLWDDCSHYVKPSTSYYDGVAAGAVWENGKRIAQLIRKKKKEQ